MSLYDDVYSGLLGVVLLSDIPTITRFVKDLYPFLNCISGYSHCVWYKVNSSIGILFSYTSNYSAIVSKIIQRWTYKSSWNGPIWKQQQYTVLGVLLLYSMHSVDLCSVSKMEKGRPTANEAIVQRTVARNGSQLNHWLSQSRMTSYIAMIRTTSNLGILPLPPRAPGWVFKLFFFPVCDAVDHPYMWKSVNYSI